MVKRMGYFELVSFFSEVHHIKHKYYVHHTCYITGKSFTRKHGWMFWSCAR